MFPKPQRLTAKRLFEAVFRRGAWIRGRSFSMITLGARQKGQIGFIVTKKVSKSAVVRNQTKRRVRAAFLHLSHQPEFASLVKDNYSVVVIHRVVTQEPFERILNEAKHILERAASQKIK